MMAYLWHYTVMRLDGSGHIGAKQYAHNQVVIARKTRAKLAALRGRRIIL